MGQKVKISISLVVYQHKYAQLSQLIEVILGLPFNVKLFIIDNSPDRLIESELPKSDIIEYHFCNENLELMEAHNKALRYAANWAEFHLVLNPDILFEPNAIVALVEYMKERPNIGLLMPKVLYANGETQYLCKLFPTPFRFNHAAFYSRFSKRKTTIAP